ncbi:hypothetical protein JEOAER750_01208 [Jeotgalicoccus aerolatus]|jgi:uncharacterized protein (DUF2062 family)|uniref:Uncharacterized protein (DUF2062 family) n=1 Tax=Jeotgalicoccus aerolatus TaxID=709510 RepID=A0A1G8UTI4_9STAP|nr:SA1362 family protein [Jeotgalicoccus aerolatus]MBP1951731.1 uncharacterized protein (DUF2062 family) [Jeotgalicoccus aerolatus]NMA81131.1 hypothetical protein [Jeotgalicoccus aerolatus]CAD2075438.1 hypothetical protein JEOAER750_01208 [Jeotgalicoccus aerolatus]SDJ56395.1 hypothetical protein SAMN05216187_10188 [Jeotgalicoccus aerolatus]GGD95243.1 hypothetical protein GCM10007273_04440 [Jeotgalicoccus aerolatus]
MKRALVIIVLVIAAVGLLMNLDVVLNMIFSSLIFLLVLGLIIYGIYYFFILTEDQRKYRKALRKAKRKHRKK